jgi:hypothetical protein
MKLLLTFILSAITILFPIAESTEFIVDGKLMSIDKLGNIFTGKKDVLYKYSNQGKLLNSYSNKLLGNITTLDVNNPLRYLVYYQDIGQVVFLDNTLSLHNEVVLEDHGFDQTTLACSSNNDAFWVYDAMEFRLLKLDEQVKIVQNSGNIIQLLGFQIKPNFILEANDKVYLNDPNHGIFVFDIYGSYIKKIPIKDLSKFQIVNKKLIYQIENNLYMLNLITLDEQTTTIDTLHSNYAIAFNQQLYFQQEKMIKVVGL